MRAVLLAFSILLAVSARAQEWTGLAGLAAEFPEGREAWTEARLAAGVRWEGTSILAEAGRLERYGQAAAFVGADAYAPLSSRVYVNARARLAPSTDVAARSDLSAEAYAAVADGWEVSAGARRLAFADRAVPLATASAARYTGPWLMRLRLTAVPDDGAVPVSVALSLRRLADGTGGPTASFWDVTAGRGQEATVLAPGQTSIRDSWFVSARVQRRVTSSLGFAVGGGYTADADLSRASVEGGVFARW